ncbi:O-antigen ligase family protein [Bradyrhizobium jicamae]|uniref:O-antigen ligase family protein n=1 Tax=Bradyrhizobium jicamae TaxID=280332 RepID=A0ABS5FPG2_9BRAD|nr:O-antigen ligase family protein [Bradyrhizobium jicamae]MBR0798226.1 O-antigen ligase family protein [Bradyrhizobium jicamae]
MTAIVGHSPVGSLARWRRDPAVWIATADIFTVLLAAALPWSTSLVAIFAVLMLIALVAFLDIEALWRSVKRPIAAVPIAFFLLAVIGTLWSPAPWGERLHAIGPTLKLLMLPLLFYHFERSERGRWVFITFLVSCALLSVMSWIVAFHPNLSLKPPAYAARGIFVKDYIDQSQEFALCAVALAYPIITLLRERRIGLAILLSAVAASFVANMAFVIVSRTALVTMPVMAVVFGLLHLRWRVNLTIAAALIAIAAVAFVASPQLEWTVRTFSRDYQLYKQGVPTSIGERLEYWRNALRFFADAPLVGNGTGSTKGLFEQAEHAPGWLAGVRVFPNPHNQTLNVAVQWGVLGIAVLYAMWLLHLLLFRGEGFANWIGLLVVVQNIFTSLFNSHIFDFHEGWMYVLGVGLAGGMVLKARAVGEAESDGDS